MIVDSVFDGHRLAREIDSPNPAMPLPFIRERRLWGEVSNDDYRTQLLNTPDGRRLVKIVVPVKQVAALDEEFELRGGDVDPAGLEWELNEWDTFSLEAALQLRDAAGEGEVVALTRRRRGCRGGLLKCLAKGADRGVRIWDDALDGADALAVARVLAAAVERESPDLVLCGVQSSDAVNGATGIALAGHLDLAHVAVVKRIELDAATHGDRASASSRAASSRCCGSSCPRC